MKFKFFRKIIIFCVFFLAAAFVLPFPTTAEASIRVARLSGMFDVYQENRSKDIPNYITEDFLLLSYAMIQKQALTRLEETTLMPALEELIAQLAKKMGKAKAKHDLANRDFVAVLDALVKGEKAIKNAGNTKRANGELSRVLAAEGILISPLWGLKMDYTQFKPRGAYTDTKQREQYFRAMKYATSALFAVKESKSTGITKKIADQMILQAMALVKTIQADKELLAAYKVLELTLSWQFGQADDLTFSDMVSVSHRAPKKIKANQLRALVFEFAKTHDRKPIILSGIVNKEKLEKELSPEDALTGWRLIPQRYTPGAAVFQDLTFDKVTAYNGDANPFGRAMINNKPVKGFPSAYELMALLGSRAAQERIEGTDETNFKGYKDAAYSARQKIATAQGLSGLHFGLLNMWLTSADPKDPGEQRRLTSGLSFWTWQKYIGVLYTKQSTTMTAKGMSLNKPRKTAWLEPSVKLYLALNYIVTQHAKISNDPVWNDFSAILDQCIEIAFKERNLGEPDVAQIAFLNNLDEKLLTLTQGKDHPIVIDVHTEPNSKLVVEEAIGFPKVVWKKTGRGALFTHYEFKHAMDQRLTDKDWKEMLTIKETYTR